MAGLIGMGRASQALAGATLRKSADMEFVRNQGNMGMDAAKDAQKKQTTGMGAGMGAYYGVQQAGAGVVAGGGGSTLTAANLGGAIGKEAVLMETAAAGSQAAAGGTAAAGGSAAGGALSTAASAIPYVAAGIAVAALFNKLFD